MRREPRDLPGPFSQRRRGTALSGAFGARPALVAVLVAAAPAVAQTFDVAATALSQGRPDPRDGSVATVIPNLVNVSLLASELKAPVVSDLKVVVSGWGGATLGSPIDGRVLSGDLDAAYVESHSRSLTLRAGRQFLVGGAVRGIQIDGGFAEVRLAEGFGASAYGGAPVAPLFGTARGDAIGGGRLYWRHGFDTELGVSFVELLDHGLVGRQDGGLDARFAPRADLTFAGSALFSLIENRLAEGEVMATYQPFQAVLIAADWRRVAPDLYISRASLFSVFSDEHREEGGGNIYFQLSRRISLNGEYHLLVVPEGVGHRASAELRYRLGRDGKTQVAAECRFLRTPNAAPAGEIKLQPPANGYFEARLYATHRASSSLFVSLESDAYFFLEPINGHTASYTASATAGYDLAPGWRVTLAAMGGSTPFLTWDVQYIAKLVWTPAFRIRQQVKS